MKRIFTFAAALAIVAMAASCSCNNNQASQDGISKQEVGQKVYEFTYPLPTAFEITEMLNRIEANYILDICNEQSNVDKYLTETKRAFNLGIYSADICYASTYNQQQTVLDYMEIIRKLIDELDESSAVEPEWPQKNEHTEKNKVDLTDLITESFYDSYEYLNKNGRAAVSMLIVSGSWIEGLYLATHISEFTFDNKEMVKIVMTQRDPLNNLMEILSKPEFDSNEDIAGIKEQLSPLHDIYNSVEGGGLSETQLESIKIKINEVRTDIVSF